MKLVKEILYEKFTEEGDPIHDMGIGIRNILYKISMKKLSHSSFNSQAIVRKVCKMMRLPSDEIYDLSELHNGKSKTQALIEKSKVIINLDYLESTVGASLVLYKNKYGIILVENTRNYWGDIDVVLHLGIEKFINEKFTDDNSDPIRDLGIGTYSLEMLVSKNKFDSSEFQEYMKQHNIGAKVVSVHTTVYVVKFIGGKTELRKLVRTFMPGYPSDLLNDKIFKVFEKFTEDSDPIRDMHIGLRRPITFNNKREITKWVLKNLTYILDVEKIPTDIIIDDKWFIKFPYLHKIKKYCSEYFSIIESGEFGDVSAVYPDWEYIRKYFEKKGYPTIIVREYLNEKFTEDDSDPIHDMGIGGYSFETLRPGAIIRSKRTGIAVTHNRSGHFPRYTGMMLQIDKSILITKIEDWKDTGKYKRIYFIKFYKEQDCAEYRNNFKLTGRVLYSSSALGIGRSNNMIVSKLMFNNRFEIIERGF